MEDVDRTATDFPDLNFIIEHAGIPRIDDFAYMAVQEPNVYAGCSVVIGAHMHARPKSFARFMGELLFWVGEDRMTFGSDYNIWTPKWQIEGFVDWQMPDDRGVLRLPAARPRRPRRRSSGSTPPSSTASRSRRNAGCPSPRRSRRSPASSWSTNRRVHRPGPRRERSRRRRLAGAGDGARPRARRADHRSRLRGIVHRLRRRGRARPPAAADLLLRAELLVPHGGRRLRRRGGGTGRDPRGGRPRGPPRVGRDQQRGGRTRGLRGDVRRGGRRRTGGAARGTSWRNR